MHEKAARKLHRKKMERAKYVAREERRVKRSPPAIDDVASEVPPDLAIVAIRGRPRR
jgi:hypothetical protein